MKIKSRVYLTALTILLLFITGCDVAGEKETTSYMLTPPSWIIGEWEDSFGINGYTFTEHNVVFYLSGTESVDFDLTYESAGITENVNSATQYTISVPGGEYTFIKTSDTILDYSITGYDYTLELIKQ